MMNKVKPLVTIAIPTYNRAACYLKHALESALSQTYPNIEIIVSDNCSPDNTKEMVNAYADLRIKYFRHAHSIKPIDNFNFCIRQAKGHYLLLLHDDDMIDDDFVETCMKTASYSSDIGIIRTGMRRIDEQGNILRECRNFTVGLSTEDFFLAWFRDKTPTHVCMSLFNADKLKQIGGFNSNYHLFSDVLAEIILAAKFGRVDIEDVKSSFRMHSAQNSSSAKVKDWCKESSILFNTACDLVDNKKSLLAIEGKKFFFRHNYRIASRIKLPIDRFRAYLVVFKSFGYFYSIGYRFRSVLYKLRRKIGKRIN